MRKTTTLQLVEENLWTWSYFVIIGFTLFFGLFFTSGADVKGLKQHKAISRHKHAEELLGRKSFARIKHQVTSRYFLINFHTQIKALLSKKNKKKSKLIANAILRASERYSFDPIFLAAVILGESAFDPRAVGSVGEIGLMQIRPHIAKWIARKFSLKYKGKKSLFDPKINIKIGAAFLNYLRVKFKKRSGLYIAAYNMGEGNVKKALRRKIRPKDYPRHVMKRYFAIYKNFKPDSTYAGRALATH